MTFDYTLPQVTVVLPDLELRGSHGKLEGVTPVLLRLDWASVENLHAFSRDPHTVVSVLEPAILATATDQGRLLNDAARGWMLETWDSLPFRAPEPRERWRAGRATKDDIADLVGRLQQAGFVEWLDSDTDQLRNTMEDLVRRHAEKRDMVGTALELGGTMLQVRWDDKQRLRLLVHDYSNPFHRARLEAMSAYTEGRPGLVRCDVCERLFVPVRAGRPARRCPGFECADIARERYQLSPERKEYRRLAMRLTRAKAGGSPEAIKRAQQELDAFKAGGTIDE